MGVEIERKFIPSDDSWRQSVSSRSSLKQGYIATVNGHTVRARISDGQGFLTLKSHAHGISRDEFEYRIPVEDAEQILESFCEKPLIEKYRYIVVFQGFTWEIDEFSGENQGLILAEIELPSEDTAFEIPPWIGKEVTHLGRYYNSNLRKHPFSRWSPEEKAGLDLNEC